LRGAGFRAYDFDRGKHAVSSPAPIDFESRPKIAQSLILNRQALSRKNQIPVSALDLDDCFCGILPELRRVRREFFCAISMSLSRVEKLRPRPSGCV